MKRSIPFILFLLLVSGPASAVDGVIELSQVCATQTGCAPGDVAGFPITLDTGSYRLTSDLDTAAPGLPGTQSAIVFSTAAPGEAIAHLDLNGFTITGNGSRLLECGTTPCLIENGNFYGRIGMRVITAATDPAFSSTIRNVRITRAGLGIDCDNACRVEDVSVSSVSVTAVIVGTHSSVRRVRYDGPGLGLAHAGGGVFAGNDSSIEDCLVRDVGTIGISCGDRCRVVDNVVHGSGFDGIRAGVQSVVTGNVSTGNAGDGIFAATSSVVADNSASNNGTNGIRTGNAATVRDNSADSNGADGIDVGTGSHVFGNTARSNGEFGLRAESVEVGYGRNVFGNNNGGPANDQTSSGTDLGGNLCDELTVCP